MFSINYDYLDKIRYKFRDVMGNYYGQVNSKFGDAEKRIDTLKEKKKWALINAKEERKRKFHVTKNLAEQQKNTPYEERQLNRSIKKIQTALLEYPNNKELLKAKQDLIGLKKYTIAINNFKLPRDTCGTAPSWSLALKNSKRFNKKFTRFGKCSNAQKTIDFKALSNLVNNHLDSKMYETYAGSRSYKWTINKACYCNKTITALWNRINSRAKDRNRQIKRLNNRIQKDISEQDRHKLFQDVIDAMK